MFIPNRIINKSVLKPLVLSSLLILSSLAQADKPAFPGVSLPEQAQGQKAIRLLADKLPDVAAWYGMTTAEFARTLRDDHSAWIDKTGHLFYIDNEVITTGENQTAPQASIPYSNTFKLHSKAGSNRVIYLDFTGFITSGKAWAGGVTINSPAFSLDTDATTFSNAEMDVIQEVWKRVAEDYAPFNVDVTTEDPGQDAIIRSSLSDQNYGIRTLITAHDSRLCSSCGGVAYVGIYDIVGDYYQPAFVFYNKLGGNAKNIAEATSHEIGHNLGLSHDGTSTTGYYQGHGTGETSWSPIMGVGYYTQLSQWSKGEYNDANQRQDDMIVINNNGVLLRADDHSGETNSTATPLNITASTTTGMNNIAAMGIISTPSDSDMFSFEMGAGEITILISSATIGTNLDIKASLYNKNGALLNESNLLEKTSAAINLQAQVAGVYYLKIEGVGKGEALVDGYTNYGSLGQFIISGSIPETSSLKAPIAIISPISAQGNAPLAVNFNAVDSYDTDGNISAYHWDFSDNNITSSLMNPSHIFNTPGDYTVTLSVTDNDALTGVTSTIINIENQIPVASASASSLSGIAPLLIDFSSAGSFDPDTAHTLRYAWDFGDGNNTSSINPSHQYMSAGNYTVTLTVSDDLGASATDSLHLTINVNPDTAPIAPSSLVASLSTIGKGKNKMGSLLFNWQDNSTNEGNFVIERCTETGKGKFKSCIYSDLTTLAANTTSYLTSYSSSVDKGIFKYKVKAVNAFGFNSSNEIKVSIK